MNDKKWEKYSALGGIVFVALNVVTSALTGAPPSSGDTDDEVAEYFLDKADGIKVSVLLAGLSIIALGWWFGALWRRMSKAEHGSHRLSAVSLVGLAASGALFMASQAPLSAVALRVDSLSPEAMRLFWVLSTVLLSSSGFFLVLHLTATNALSLRSGMFAKWSTIVGLLTAVAFLVASFGVMTDADGIMIFGLFGFVLWSIWLIAVSVQMWRTADVA